MVDLLAIQHWYCSGFIIILCPFNTVMIITTFILSALWTFDSFLGQYTLQWLVVWWVNLRIDNGDYSQSPNRPINQIRLAMYLLTFGSRVHTAMRTNVVKHITALNWQRGFIEPRNSIGFESPTNQVHLPLNNITTSANTITQPLWDHTYDRRRINKQACGWCNLVLFRHNGLFIIPKMVGIPKPSPFYHPHQNW